MTLKYKGQKIDLCGADSQKLYNKGGGKWVKERVKLSKEKKKKVYSLIVPVIPPKDLINYKRKISREVDIRDIESLSRKL